MTMDGPGLLAANLPKDSADDDAMSGILAELLRGRPRN